MLDKQKKTSETLLREIGLPFYEIEQPRKLLVPKTLETSRFLSKKNDHDESVHWNRRREYSMSEKQEVKHPERLQTQAEPV